MINSSSIIPIETQNETRLIFTQLRLVYVCVSKTHHMIKCIEKHTKNLTPINPTCPGLHLYFAINGDQSQLHCCCFLPVEMQQTFLSGTSHAKTIDYIASPHTHNPVQSMYLSATSHAKTIDYIASPHTRPVQSMYLHVFRVPLKQSTTTRKTGSNNGGW